MYRLVKVFLIFVTFCVTSMYYFPFVFTFFPSANTKMIIAAIGAGLCALQCISKKEICIPKNLIPIFCIAGIVSLTGLFSMTYNRTIDDAYSGYIVSMAVWLSGAYTVCSLIKKVHSTINIRIVGNYLIVVCVAQCIEAMMIDNIPSFQRFVDTYVNMNQNVLHDIHRLYGIGACLDVAGARFSAVMVLLTHLAYNSNKKGINYPFLLYTLSFSIIVVLGSMIARTTYVGVIMSCIYIVFNPSTWTNNISKEALNKLVVITTAILIAITTCTILYHSDPQFRHWLRFAFEGFFNLFEQGEYSVASNSSLMDMYVFPDTLKTWIIGDGYFSNPYWSDPNYIWQDQNIQGYYMGTDVGYLRFIFYFGLIGLTIFSVFFIKVAQTCMNLMNSHKLLFLLVLAAGFIIWLKVATDLFCFFALFLCVGNMMPDEVEDEEDDDIDATEIAETCE